ncbi:MAG: DUF2178 domain-containing protein [Candidatus Izemoplasmatales bacterium]
MKKNLGSYVFYLGLGVFVIGIILQIFGADNEGTMESLSNVLKGFGAGIIAVGVANIIRKKLLEKNPQKAKLYEINENDERNIRIREKAGCATWYSTVFILAAISMTFVVLDYHVPGYISIGALFIHVGSMFVYMYIYNKKI